MSRLPAIEMRRFEAVQHPGAAAVRAKLDEFMARRGIGIEQMARLAGVGEATLGMYLRGTYEKFSHAHSTEYMDARLWVYLMQNWPRDAAPPSEELIETRGYRKILECIEEAVANGAISLIYGPPSSEKSFVAENVAAQWRAAGRRDLLRVVCSPVTSPLWLLRDIAREAEVWTRGNCCRTYSEALVAEFLSRPRPPAIIVDEAQHLDMRCMEILRILLHELTRRGSSKGCGLILMGSHNLYARFKGFAARYSQEQMLSRLSYRVQLEGMTEEEVICIAARALGSNGKSAKLPRDYQNELLAKCRADDPYATDADGKRLRGPKGEPFVKTYYSSRRLLEHIRQKKLKGLSLILAEEVA
ncbi:MAG: AAA family ATPase [Candidatus Acidiferrales bacterium]